MSNDLSEIESRLRATFQAVASTTVVGADGREGQTPRAHGFFPPPEHRRPRRLVTAMAVLAILIIGAAVTMVVARDDTDRAPTAIATAPITTPRSEQPGSSAPSLPVPTCGLELPRPLDLPEGYLGPQRVAASEEGQLVLSWTSTTGSIIARWPPDPQFRQILGPSETTPDGQPSVSSAGSMRSKETGGGGYIGTIVFGLRNVTQECRSIQLDVLDSDAARVDAGIARLSNKGLFVSNVPLVVASEERAEAPAVTGCNAPPGVSPPPNRGGPVSGQVHPTPADALKAFLDADSSLIPNQYLEVRLPDGSIVYAKEQPMRPGFFVTVIHVVRTGSGWSVDRWQGSGC